MTVGERIKCAREAKGYSQEELGRLVHTTKQTIYKYETGKVTNIPVERFRAICGVLELDPADMLGWPTECTEPVYDSPVARIYQRLNTNGKAEYVRYGNYLCSQEEYAAKDVEPEPIEYIRHYFTAAAAGYAAPIEGEDFELIPKDSKAPARADFCIDIAGDSMEPYIHDGQRVYVQRDTSDLKEFDVGIFFVDGDVYCKQWCVDYVGTLHLLSANPEREDANIRVSRDSARNALCFGKVILPKRLPQPAYY